MAERRDRARHAKQADAVSGNLQDIQDLERKLKVMELKTLQVEAEIRYLKAQAERRKLKGTRADFRALRRKQKQAHEPGAENNTDE